MFRLSPLLALSVCGVLALTPAHAQQNQAPQQQGNVIPIGGPVNIHFNPTQFEVTFDLREAERKAIVAQNMDLSISEAEEFWRVYEVYRKRHKNIIENRFKSLNFFSRNINDLSKEDTDTIIKQEFGIAQAVMQERLTFLNEISQFLPSEKYFRYFQIEERVDAMMHHQMTEAIPLIPIGDKRESFDYSTLHGETEE